MIGEGEEGLVTVELGLERSELVVDRLRNCVLVNTRANARDLEACNIMAAWFCTSMRIVRRGDLYFVCREVVLTFEVASI